MTIRDAIVSKLHPSRFDSMSAKMTAFVQMILSADYGVTPQIPPLVVTSDGYLIGNEPGGAFYGSYRELLRNWTLLLDAAKLDADQRALANNLFVKRVNTRWLA